MDNILIRSGVSPYDIYSPADYLRKNFGGGNSGNLLYAASVYRNLSGHSRNLESNYYSLNLDRISEINEDYSYFVCPLANAFRPGFREIERLTEFIKRLTIPCIVAGVAGQFEYDPSFTKDSKFEFDKKSRDFCYAVLDKCSTIGVRGEITATYLKQVLKIPESKIDVIGSPSLYYFGSEPPSLKKYKDYADSVVSFHCSASIKPKLWNDLLEMTKCARDRFYIPQANYDLRILYYGMPFERQVINYPRTLRNQFYMDDKVRFFTRADSWVDFYKTNVDYAIGTKVQGTIAAILGGLRTILFATDSRTRELAEFHHIPFLKYDGYSCASDLVDLINRENLMEEFYKSYSKNYDIFKQFMLKNGLPISEKSDVLNSISMVKEPEVGNVRSFLKVDEDEKINRMIEGYSELQRTISKLSAK